MFSLFFKDFPTLRIDDLNLVLQYKLGFHYLSLQCRFQCLEYQLILEEPIAILIL